MRVTGPIFFALALFCFISSPQLSAQTVSKSHEDCLKLVPGDWGPNFGEEWRQHEAVYWGCRLGVPVETVKAWQEVVSGNIQELIPITIDKQQLVLIEDRDGSANCFTISALKKKEKGWEPAWGASSKPDSMDYCTLACPPIKLAAQGKNLTLKFPETSDPKEDQTFSCKHVKWKKETYRWNGKTYEPAKVGSHNRSV